MDQHYFYRAYSHTASDIAKRLWFCVRSAGWFACSPDYIVKRAGFYDYQLLYVVRGEGEIIWHERTLLATPGNVVFLDLHDNHQYRASQDNPWEIFWVHFAGPHASDYFHLLMDACDNPVFSGSSATHMSGWFREIYENTKCHCIAMEPKVSLLITQILTMLVLDRLENGVLLESFQTLQYPKTIKDGIQYMRAHFQDPLTLEQVAKHAGLSPFHFSRLFKRATGISLLEYLLGLRLDQAKFLLSETPLTVREISEKCGFSDQGYFGRVFKRYESMTPSQFRLSHKETQGS